MNKKIIDTIHELAGRLKSRRVTGMDAFLGFDACIDVLVRVVSERDDNNSPLFFKNSSQFGEFLVNLDNHSCGLELQTKLSKIGGNMVIMGNALGNLGVRSDCLGTFGLPEILPVFHSMSKNCSLVSIGDTITATALEFSDSKVIMFDPGPYVNLGWEDIKNIAGLEKIKQLVSGKKLISFVNWSEIENSTLIWNGFLNEIFPDVIPKKNKPIFFTDFSDCSRRSAADIRSAIELIGMFREYFRVAVSLNENESNLIASALGIDASPDEEDFVKRLCNAVSTDILAVHRLKDALAYDGEHFEKCDTFLCEHPAILTGGGDNFNAGFCFSLLNELNLFDSLIVANAVSGSYVKTGISPDVESLVAFLLNHY